MGDETLIARLNW